MITHRRSSSWTAGLLVAGALLSGACKTDVNGPSKPILSANRTPSLTASRGAPAPSAASGFTVLAQEAVSCSGGSITGSVGTFRTTPPGAITLTTGCAVISGSTDIGGPAAVAAYNAFVAQYDALAPTACDRTILDVAFTDNVPALGPLAPGVYCFPAAVTFTRTTLTLSGPANGIWIFKVGSPGPSGTGALTGTDFSVALSGGAQACNVTWWVSQAATTTRGAFLGNILAGAAISMSAGTSNGNAWAGAKANVAGVRVGDVTLTEGTTIAGCAAVAGGGGGGGGGDDGDDNEGDNDHKGHHDKDKHHDKDDDHGKNKHHDNDNRGHREGRDS